MMIAAGQSDPAVKALAAATAGGAVAAPHNADGKIERKAWQSGSAVEVFAAAAAGGAAKRRKVDRDACQDCGQRASGALPDALQRDRVNGLAYCTGCRHACEIAGCPHFALVRFSKCWYCFQSSANLP